MRRHSTRLSQAHDEPDEGDGLARTADRDYPEFGSILDDRPDPGSVITVIGARRLLANAYGTDQDDRNDDFNGEPGDTGVYWQEPGQQQWMKENEPQEPAPPPPWAMSPVMARLAEMEEAQDFFGMRHHATDINGVHVDDHGDAPQHGTVPRAQDPDSYDGRSTEGDGDPKWDDPVSDVEKEKLNGATTGMYPEGISAGGGPGISVGPFTARVPWTGQERGTLHSWQQVPTETEGDFVSSAEFPFLRPGQRQHDADGEVLRAEGRWKPYDEADHQHDFEDRPDYRGWPEDMPEEYNPRDWTDIADKTDHGEDVGGWVHHTLSSLREAASDAEDRYWHDHLAREHGWGPGQFDRARMRGDGLADMHAADHDAGLVGHAPHAITGDQRLRAQRDMERERSLRNMFGAPAEEAPGKESPEGWGLAHPARGGYAGGDPANAVANNQPGRPVAHPEHWEERDPARYRRMMSSLQVHAHDNEGDSLDSGPDRTGPETGFPQASVWSGMDGPEDDSLDDGPSEGDGSGEHPEQWPMAGAGTTETGRAMTQGRFDGKTQRGGWDHLGAFVAAAGSPSFRFEFTAAWSDVIAKAKRIRAEGHVRITHATAGMVIGEVRGDHDTYESGLQRPVGRRQAIQHWACGCPWASFHQDKTAGTRYAGRPCSHVMALQFEAQSRGMFGRQVGSDESLPSWSPPTVVVKSMPPWEGEPHAGRWREEWRAPVASLHRTGTPDEARDQDWTPEERDEWERATAPCHRATGALLRSGTDQGEVDALRALAGLPPVSADLARSGALLARHLTVAHGLPEDKVEERVRDLPGALAWHDLLHEARAGVRLPHRHDEPGEPGAGLSVVQGMRATADSANQPWGSDNTVSHPPQKPYGATSPPDKDMDPGSYGPLAAPDPENWGRIDAGDVFQMPIGNTAAVHPVPGDLHWPDQSQEDQSTFGYAPRANAAGPSTPMTPRDPNGIRMEEALGEQRDEPEAALPSTTGDDIEATAAADGTIGGGDAGDGAVQEAPLDTASLGEFGAALDVRDRPASSGSVRDQFRAKFGGPTAMGDQSVAEGLSGGAQEPSAVGQQPGMGSMDEPLMPDDQSIQTVGTQQWSGGGADSDEVAVPAGQPQGGIDDIVASFQRSAAASAYKGGGGPGGGEPGDIAAAARAYLSKTADVLPQAEADELIREGRGQRARNLDLLDLKDTHYEDEDGAAAKAGVSMDDYDDDVIFA
jgi:hypothetical protein